MSEGVVHVPNPKYDAYLTAHIIPKLNRHHDALRTKIGHYVQNNLPIRLIDVSTMALVDRATLQEQIGEMATQGPFTCEESDCHCFEKAKDQLKYSILSHRWGFPELTFGDYLKLHEQVTRNPPSSFDEAISRMQTLWEATPYKSSLDKLLGCLKVTTQRQCKYAWIDTICINKESSAELDESIRSMYAWYRDSHICIVHLSQTHLSWDMNNDAWFTRGWTLQELLAPKAIKFFSSSWQQMTLRENDKDLSSTEQEAAKRGQDQPPLWSTISKITGIPIDDLLDFKPGLYDISKRMGWAAKRRTTRVEDIAYCLIGIFRVNLSISYGEKEGAFYRLQAEIMQNSDDESLFDWQGSPSTYNSMFALFPECFSQALGLAIENKPPVGTDPISTSAANFDRRVSRIVFYKSELPDLEVWTDSKATAFTFLGPSTTPGEYLMMVLEQIGDEECYKRMKVIKTPFDLKKLPFKNASEILIKYSQIKNKVVSNSDENPASLMPLDNLYPTSNVTFEAILLFNAVSFVNPVRISTLSLYDG
ncbi:hypothetical protein FRC19_004527 [Serendipita sp. 401]|nr:hypothetical protein FRC19_004527 [Serendipita sp. 401]